MKLATGVIPYKPRPQFKAYHKRTQRFAKLVCHRRFGKTVNLSTLRYFVEKLSEDRSALFEGLSVWGSREARGHFQRYPVISLTFKDVKARTFDEAFRAIRREICRMYEEHAYLLDAGALRPQQAARFEQILAAEGPEDLYADALRELSLLLARFHGEGVFVRKTPVMSDRVRAYSDGTALTIIGDDVDGDGQHWKYIRTPDGLEGYVPAMYTTTTQP